MKNQKIELDEMMEREARLILEKVVEFGDGDVAVGMIRAVELGVDDMTRWLDHGNLPFTKDIIDFHREKFGRKVKETG